MRMYRYFNRSIKSDKIEMYLKKKCKLGDWFVLYQLSKNLNKPFFMEFLSRLPEEINFRGVVLQATGVKPSDEHYDCPPSPMITINDKGDDKIDKQEVNNIIHQPHVKGEYII